MTRLTQQVRQIRQRQRLRQVELSRPNMTIKQPGDGYLPTADSVTRAFGQPQLVVRDTLGRYVGL